MVPLAVVVALSLVACTYTAPESLRPTLHSVATGRVIETNPESQKTKPVEGRIGLLDVENDSPAEKSSGVSTTVKKGELDRGLVSDVIESTLGGMHLGFAIGSNNGTLDRLCIKLGNITMAGCRRTASLDKKITEVDDNMNSKSKI